MRKKILLSLILILFVCVGVFFAVNTTSFVSAKTINVLAADGGEGEGAGGEELDPEPTLTQSQINSLFEKGYPLSPATHIKDSVLYGRLLDVVADYAEAIGYNFTGDELYSEMFTTYAVEDKMFSPTQIVIENDLIESLEGLEYLRLDNITKLTVSSNKLTTIKSEYFQNMENLEYLNLADNQITNCDISNLKNLKYLNLSTNKLTELDLTNIRITSNIEINLANNDLVDLAKVKLPTSRASGNTSVVKLNVMANNIYDISEEYFNINKLSLEVGIQGLKNTNITKIDTATPLKVYKMNQSDIRLVVYKKLNLLDREVYKVITDTEIGDYCYQEVLPVGDYIYEYEKLSAGEYAPIYDKYDVNNKVYKGQEFQVNPKAATYLYEYKGKTTETLGKVTGDIKLHLFCEEGGKISYCYNGSDWIEGTTITVSGGGTRYIMVKVEKDGYVSEIQTIKVETSLNKFVPDFLMFALVFALALVLFLVVIPLVSKKFFKK